MRRSRVTARSVRPPRQPLLSEDWAASFGDPAVHRVTAVTRSVRPRSAQAIAITISSAGFTVALRAVASAIEPR
jgi:hypothetical protein